MYHHIGREETEGFVDGRKGMQVSPEEGNGMCETLYWNHTEGKIWNQGKSDNTGPCENEYKTSGTWKAQYILANIIKTWWNKAVLQFFDQWRLRKENVNKIHVVGIRCPQISAGEASQAAEGMD